jgi:hypothetical protein
MNPKWDVPYSFNREGREGTLSLSFANLGDLSGFFLFLTAMGAEGRQGV